jgi:amino acid transporter
MLAVAITRNPLLILLIGLGFTLNAFQIVCNCYIGVTRIMVAMSLDRLLPEWFSKVHERFHTPLNAHLAYFLLSIPIFALYSFKYGDFVLFTLGVTFGCGYVFAATALAGAFLPTRAKALYDASPGSRYNVNGLLGLILMLVGLVTFAWTPGVWQQCSPACPSSSGSHDCWLSSSQAGLSIACGINWVAGPVVGACPG